MHPPLAAEFQLVISMQPAQRAAEVMRILALAENRNRLATDGSGVIAAGEVNEWHRRKTSLFQLTGDPDTRDEGAEVVEICAYAMRKIKSP